MRDPVTTIAGHFRRGIVRIKVIETGAMPDRVREEVRDLCCESYEEDVAETFADVGPGVHSLLRADGTRPPRHRCRVLRVALHSGTRSHHPLP